MPLFSYQALDSKGKKRTGLIDAHNELDARKKLREQGIMVTKLQQKVAAAGKENLRGEQLMTFTMQLSQLVSAGMPVYESLNALEEQYRGATFHRVLLSLCDQIKAGKPLSEAMANYPASFDRLYCSMINAGESAGALEIVLEKLSELLEKKMKLKNEITTAMIYPAILSGFSLLVISLLLGFVIPSIEGIFADRELPTFTAFVIGASHFFREYWWLYVPLLVGSVGWFIWKMRTPQGKLWLERFLMKIPLVKTLMVQAAVARFCRTMGTLQKGGLTVIDSLRIAREVMGNATLEDEVKRAEAKIVEGSSLSAEFAQSKWIPHLVTRMLAVGEESGASVQMLNKIASMYENDLEKTLAQLMALAQPIIMIVMGVIIGTVLLAILLPLTDMSSFAL